jgi:hypothetical protein
MYPISLKLDNNLSHISDITNIQTDIYNQLTFLLDMS